MIYVKVDPDDPIRQGDIFAKVPRVDLDLDNIPVVHDDGVERRDWLTALGDFPDGLIEAVVSIQAVLAIVATQDCDALRAPEISLAQIVPFGQVEGGYKPEQATPKSFSKLLTRQAKVNLKWFYLPKSKEFGIPVPMGADFRSIIRVPQPPLSAGRQAYRLGRLIPEAYEHYRERLAEFFRRYPYNEWYPLDSTQFAEYQKTQGDDVPAYPWQRPAEGERGEDAGAGSVQ